MNKREGGSWKKFQQLRFNAKNVGEHMQRAESATTRHARKFIFQRLSNVREARREIIVWLVTVAVMIASVVVQLAWFGSNYLTPTAAAGGTYSEASRGPIDTLNPLYATSDAELSASRLLFSSLYKNDTTGHLAGDIATTLSVDDTGKIYTVKLRPNVTWSDDARLTAADVIYTINLIKNPNTRTQLAINWRDVEVKALNDTTVQFTLPAAYAAFPQALTFPVVPEHILKDISPGVLRQSGFSTNPVGSGPFTFVSMRDDEGGDGKIVRLDANQNYYKGVVKLEHFDIHAVNNTDGLLRAMRSGRVNAVASIDPENSAKAFSGNTKFNQKYMPVNGGVYALFNTKNEVLADASIRTALRSAIDTEAIRKSIPGTPPKLYLPFVDGQVGDTSDIKAPTFSMKRAAEILDQAGWKKTPGSSIRQKDSKQLRLSMTTIKDTTYERVAKAIAKNWSEVGVKIDIATIDTQQPNSSFVQTVLQPRNFDVLLYELELGSDPDVYAYWTSSQASVDGYNFTSYSNPIVDANLASARTIHSTVQRNLKYKAFARQWLRDVPAVGLYQDVSVYTTTRSSASLDTRAKLVTPEDRYANIAYWSVGQKIVYKTP